MGNKGIAKQLNKYFDSILMEEYTNSFAEVAGTQESSEKDTLKGISFFFKIVLEKLMR